MIKMHKMLMHKKLKKISSAVVSFDDETRAQLSENNNRKNISNLCLARTRSGLPCQKPPLKSKSRCRLHGGLSTGPRTADGKARIASANYKHGRRSKKFNEIRKQIWAELRKKEKEMKAQGYF